MIRHKLLGLNVDVIEEDEAYERILQLSELDTCAQVVFLDTYLLMKAKFNKELFNIINASSLVIPTSKGIRNGLSFISKKRSTIFEPHKFTIRLLSSLEEYHKIIYLLGGGKKMIQKAEKNIKDSFPGNKLMGSYHIHFKKDFEKKLLTNIQKISPSLLIVSMTRPKQEKWIAKYKNSLKRGVCIGVEDFVNYVGEKDLAPYDKLFHAIRINIKNFFRSPKKTLYYTVYFFYLLVYKLFKLEKI